MIHNHFMTLFQIKNLHSLPIVLHLCLGKRHVADTMAISKAIKVLKAFVDQIDQFQSLSSPITILPGVVTKDTTDPFNNTNVCPPAMPKS